MQNTFDFLPDPLGNHSKPRSKGITVANDRWLSLADVQSAIEVSGDIIDHVKCTDHVGILWRLPAAYIKRKNVLWNSAGISTLPGGIPFQVAAVHNEIPKYLKRVSELGFKGVEISEDMIDSLPEGARSSSISQARELGLQVFTELGKKFPDAPLEAGEAIERARIDIEAGCYKIVIEKTDVAFIHEKRADTLHSVVEAVGLNNIIFEIGPGSDIFNLAHWLIREFGAEVNLENLNAGDAPLIEAMRYGLARAAEYNYFKRKFWNER
jgi:phosphosulfolactate synthase